MQEEVNKKRTMQSTKSNKKKERLTTFLLALCLVIMILIIIFVIVFVIKKAKADAQKKLEPQVQYSTGIKQDKNLLDKTRGKPEEARIREYFLNIKDALNRKDYEYVYSRLYPGYKEQYFPTFEKFKEYMEENFPTNIGFNENGFDKIGDYYVLKADIFDSNNLTNGKKLNNEYFVFKEYNYADFVFSFSKA